MLFALKLLCSSLLFSLFAETAPEIVIPDIFSTGMVIQQQKPVRVWGEGSEINPVTVEFAGETKKAAFQGVRWSADFPAQTANGQSLTMKIFSNEKLVREIKEIQIGEVWLASGQSNMEMHLDMTKEGEASMLRPADPLLRSFTVSTQLLSNTKSPLNTPWQSASPDLIGKWSAVGYHFTSQLRERLKVPVAIIHCSRGASSTETWCRPEMLQQLPDYEQLHHFKIKDDPKTLPQQKPSFCYERMLTTILGYPIRGTIWYQGEANGGVWQEQDMGAKELDVNLANLDGLPASPFTIEIKSKKSTFDE